MVIHIFCKLEKASYNIFFVRAVMVKSLYTLQLSSGYNDLLNSENLKVAIAQLCPNLRVENSLEIALSVTVSRYSHFFIFHKNPRWPPKVAKIKILTLFTGHSCTTLWVKNSLEISYGFRDSHTFSFTAKIQDGR